MATPLVSSPYGRDTYCLERIVPGRLVDGATLVAQACFRRLRTERGQLEDDQGYGLGLSAWLGAERTQAELAALPAIIRGELLKDDRVESVDVRATAVTGTSGRIELDLVIEALLDDGETFALSLHANDVMVEVLGLRTGGTT